MKRAWMAALLSITVSLAWAQDKPKAKAVDPEAKVERKAKPAKAEPAAEGAAPVARKSRRAEDARHCLEKTSNNEVIKCAEAYL